ncbi:MAG: DnaB-like helicase C-terminal domain-containing protein [Victivallales bacterium]
MNERPNNVEAAIVAAVMIEPQYLDLLKSSGITEQTFADSFLGRVYATMRELSGRGITPDLLALSEAFPDRTEDLLDIQSGVVSTAEIESWIRLAKEDQARRMIARGAAELSGKLKAPNANPQELITEIGVTLEKASALIAGRKETTLKDALREYLEARAAGSADAVHWFKPHTEGRSKMHQLKREMFIIAADSGEGKTEIACSVVRDNLLDGKACMYVCTESGTGDILARIAAQFCGVSHQIANMEYPPVQEMRTLSNQMRELAEDYADRLFIFGSETGVNSPEAIRQEVKRIIAEHGRLDLLVVDYIQDLTASAALGRKDQHERIGGMAKHIHDTLMLCNVGGIILSQLSRDTKNSGPPGMNRLRGSGELEHCPHAIMMLWRDKKNHETKFYSVKTRNMAPVSLTLKWTGAGYESAPRFETIN